MGEQLKDKARRFFESQDQRKGAADPELCGEGYTAYVGVFPPMDYQGHHEFAVGFYSAFPDLRHNIEDIVAEGDKVVVHWRVTGTNTESFMGMPATGKPIDVGAFVMLTFASGKVVKLNAEFDQMGLMQQIGAIPAQVG